MRKYSWTLSLLVVAICSGLAARAFALYVTTGWTTDLGGGISANSANVRQVEVTRPTDRDITAVVRRNILCSTCAPAAATGTERGGEQPNGAATSFSVPENLKLIVTIISDEAGWSFAAIRDTQDGRTALHTIRSVVSGGATIKAIRDRHVVLAHGNQEGILALNPTVAGAPTAPVQPRARVRRGGPLSSVAAGVRTVGPRRYEIQRGALNKLLDSPHEMAKQARIVPHVRGGRPHGFTLHRMRRGGIYQLLGFKNGDNIHAVNGRAFTDAESVLPIYRKLRRASHVTISYTRRGKTLTHDYTIR